MLNGCIAYGIPWSSYEEKIKRESRHALIKDRGVIESYAVPYLSSANAYMKNRRTKADVKTICGISPYRMVEICFIASFGFSTIPRNARPNWNVDLIPAAKEIQNQWAIPNVSSRGKYAARYRYTLPLGLWIRLLVEAAVLYCDKKQSGNQLSDLGKQLDAWLDEIENKKKQGELKQEQFEGALVYVGIAIASLFYFLYKEHSIISENVLRILPTKRWDSIHKAAKNISPEAYQYLLKNECWLQDLTQLCKSANIPGGCNAANKDGKKCELFKPSYETSNLRFFIAHCWNVLYYKMYE